MLDKKLRITSSIVCLFILFTITGCQKLQDYIYTHGNADYKACSIKKVTSISAEDTTTYIFTYNSFGDPVSITHNNVFTGRPNYSFYYDNKKRLIRFVKPYTNGKYDEWQEYEYNNKNQIVKATAYTFGDLAGNIPQPSPYLAYLYFDYDAQGRISHVRQENIVGSVVSVSEKNYVYDANGNLVNGAVYDNKLNPNRTNAVWMFITRNYSLNNPFVATQYNKNNLPTHCHAIDIVPSGGDVYIDYLCQ